MTTAAPVTGTTTAARVVDAAKVYGTGDTEVRALDGVSVGFPAGRFTAIMGPSGSPPDSTPSPPAPPSSATPSSGRSTTAGSPC